MNDTPPISTTAQMQRRRALARLTKPELIDLVIEAEENAPTPWDSDPATMPEWAKA